jgi:hypothetical protein
MKRQSVERGSKNKSKNTRRWGERRKTKTKTGTIGNIKEAPVGEGQRLLGLQVIMGLLASRLHLVNA